MRGVMPAKKLDVEGRCCGRKPLVYKRDGGPHRFCVRCDAAYDLDGPGEQIVNWAYRAAPGGFVSTLSGRSPSTQEK